MGGAADEFNGGENAAVCVSRPGDVDRFLLTAAELLHRYGTPSHRFERVMSEVARSVGTQGVFLYTPTALVAALGTGDQERTYLRRVDCGPVDAGKLWQFDAILEEVEAGRMGVAEAGRALRAAAAAPPAFGGWATAFAAATACSGVAVLFGGGAWEVLVAGMIGLMLAGMERIALRRAWERGLLEPVAGATAALLALGFAHWIHPLDDRVTTLAALIVLLPGLSLTIALTELAVGHLSAGVARLAGALVTLLTLVLGVALVWRWGGSWRELPIEPVALPSWSRACALMTAPAAFAVLFRVRWSQWPVIYGVCLAGVTVSQLGTERWGVECGSFLGALTVGAMSNLYARWRDRPALIPSTPGMIILVPGALGYRSLTALLESQTMAGVEFAFSTLLIAASLVGGLLVAGALVSPKRIL